MAGPVYRRSGARFFAAVMAAMTIVIAGCGGDSAATEPRIAVAAVSVTLPQTAVLPGASVQAQVLTRDASGRELSGRTVTWASSNAASAAVNGAGLVTAIAPGVAIISATSEGQTGQVTLQVLAPVASVSIGGSSRVKVGDNYTYTATARAADGSVLDRAVTWKVREAARAQITPAGVLTPLQAGTITIVAQIDGADWESSYNAYDWVNFSSAGTTIEFLEADISVTNRLGTSDFPELAMTCSASGNFFLWVRTPHIVTRSGIVAFSFDGGAAVAQTWDELSPEYRSLWVPGSNGAVRTFAAQVAASRQFAFAFGEYLSNASKATIFRVTGMGPRFAALATQCPEALRALAMTTASAVPSIADRAVAQQVFATRDASRSSLMRNGAAANDAQLRFERGSTDVDGAFMPQWPVWPVASVKQASRATR